MMAIREFGAQQEALFTFQKERLLSESISFDPFSRAGARAC